MSDEMKFTGAVVVLIPAADDPVSAAASSSAHITMAWLGDAAELKTADDVLAAVKDYAAKASGPISANVKERGTLGDDDADVVFVEGEDLLAYRTGLVGLPAVDTAMNATEQKYPDWLPHVTLGYPERPALSEYSGETITFDRIGLWQGDDSHEDFALGEPAPEEEEKPAPEDDDIPEDEMGNGLMEAYAGPVPWHGILAPVEKMSGDGRIFSAGGIEYRDFPLPFKAMRKDLPGHDESIVVGNITNAWEQDGLIFGEGTFVTNADAAYFIQLRAENAMRGISVDLDSAESQLEDENGNPVDMWAMLDDPDFDPTAKVVERVTKGRLASATICAIPAFQEAWFDLGTWEEAMASHEECVDCQPAEEPALAAAGGWGAPARTYAETFVAEGPWDGSASRFTDDQWKTSCVVDRGENHATAKERYAVPIKEPSGELSRAGTHAAAGRIDQVDAPPEAIAAGKAKLRSAYDELGEEPPESITASGAAETFAPGTKDGPGWVTNPEDTQRIRNYWVKGEGAAKIKWGVPGDFNRCRSQLVKYVQNPDWLAGLCANMHKEALGIWPGGETGQASEEAPVTASAEMSPAYTLVASAAPENLPPRAWFDDPKFEKLTALTVTDDGQVFGHAAGWGVCHIGMDKCVMAPKSQSKYAYFHTGVLTTDDGDVAVGNLTFATGHASLDLGYRPAVSHYDNTGTVFADVRAGEDKFGIWIAGQMRPGLTDAQIREFKAAALSGDWREIAGQPEFVAALAVNVPGFPIPRTAMAASGARLTALVAAAVVVDDEREHGQDDSMREFVRAAVREVRAEEKRQAKADDIRAALVKADAEEVAERREAVLVALGGDE